MGLGESVEDCGVQEEDTSWLISVLRDTPYSLEGSHRFFIGIQQ
jgi:hypothetical protein